MNSITSENAASPTSVRLGALIGCKPANLYVIGVYFCVLFNVSGRPSLQESPRQASPARRRHNRRTPRVNVELRDLVEARASVLVTCILFRVNAIYGAGIDARGVSGPNAGFGDDVCHGSPPPNVLFTLRLRRDEIQAGGAVGPPRVPFGPLPFHSATTVTPAHTGCECVNLDHDEKNRETLEQECGVDHMAEIATSIHPARSGRSAVLTAFAPPRPMPKSRISARK